jgi:uncharacterized protein
MSKASPSADDLAKQIAVATPSPTGRIRAPAMAACGRFEMRIARDGTWYYRGSPIGRIALVKLFATVLRRDEQGDFWLITPAEQGRIEVEDAPFVAVELNAVGKGPDQALTLRTNLDEIVAVDRDHPLRIEHDPVSGEPSPYVLVRDGLEARLNRAVYYELVELGLERRAGDDHVYGVWSAGCFFPLGWLGAADGAGNDMARQT